jgi:DNA-binding beta-propeller fold protein YncE
VSDWNYGDGVVTVIDGRTDQVIDTITGLGGGSYGIGVNPYTNRIYVDNVQYGYRAPYEISVIDGATDKILTNVTIGLMGPHGVSTVPGPTIAPLTVNPSTGLIYAACAGCMASGNSNSENLISVINGTTNTVVGEISLSALDISVNPNTNTIYATLGIDPITYTIGSSQVAVIDGQSNSVISYQELDNMGSSVAVNPQNDFVYITVNDRNSSSITQFYIGR